jgi:hypothetical protein
MLERGEIVLYNGIDITIDLEVLRFWSAKIRAIVRVYTLTVFYQERSVGPRLTPSGKLLKQN